MIKYEIIKYEDNHVLVADKPHGILTQEGEGDSLEQRCKQYIKEKYNKPGNVFLAAVHRLDKPAAGLVLFARTSKALSRLNESMRAGLISKTYVAKVEGILEEKEATLEHNLIHGDHKAFVSEDPSAKKALLTYKVLREDRNVSTVEIKLITGRYHQIRAQFAAIGHPLVGDRKYGSQIASANLQLVHAEISFPHPITKEITCVRVS